MESEPTITIANMSAKDTENCSENTKEANYEVKYKEFTHKLDWKTKIFYSFGHIYNDLCASIWFSYTLLYFKLSFDDSTAGLLLLLGQVADAISTPLVGYGSDKSVSVFGNYGRRKIWHLIGSVFVTCSFPFIFNSCILCSDTSQWGKFAYYSIFIGLFQFGWASVQVAHLSLITDLTNISSERVELNAYRQAATVSSSICVYTITLLLLGVEDSTISQKDSIVFMKVVHLITLIGIVFSVLFHVFVSEPKQTELVQIEKKNQADIPRSASCYSVNLVEYTQSSVKHSQLNCEGKVESNGERSIHNNETILNDVVVVENNQVDAKEKLSPSENKKPIKRDHNMRIWSDWLSSISFWKVCLIYMMSRLYVNVTQVYTPLYLQETLQLAKRNIAIVPFITYFTGFIFSLTAKSRNVNSNIIMSLGCFFGFISCVWIWYSHLGIAIWEVFIMASVFGIGGTFMLIGSLSLTADLIDANKISGAFVFGLMSLFDKLINGGVIALVQHLKPTDAVQPPLDIWNGTTTTNDYPIPKVSPSNPIPTVFYLNVLVYVSGAAVIVTFLSLSLIMKKEIREFAQNRIAKCKCLTSDVVHKRGPASHK